MSTMAFAVSTETIGWSVFTVSPGLTCHSTISASCRPSPKSGSLKIFMLPLTPSLSPCGGEGGFLVSSGKVDRAQRRGHDALDAGDVLLLEPRERHHRVVAGDTLHRRHQGHEAVLAHRGGDFRGEARRARRFGHDDAAPGAGDGSEYGLEVVGLERRNVDHLGHIALLRE